MLSEFGLKEIKKCQVVSFIKYVLVILNLTKELITAMLL